MYPLYLLLGGLQFNRGSKMMYILERQECIPVGCVPSAAVAVSLGRGGVCLGGWVSAWGGGCLPGGVCQMCPPPRGQNDRHV